MSVAIDTLIDEAIEYAFPLYETARTRYRDLLGADGLPGLPTNQVLHDRRVCDHLSRWVTTPNNDTLYSRAWLDLSNAPVHVEVSRLPPGRYWSIAFIDAWTRNVAVIGRHTDDGGPLRVTLAGPGVDPGEAPGRVVRMPGTDAWLLARWLVDPEGDPGPGHAMQSCLSVSSSAIGRPVRPVPSDDLDPAAFVAVVAERMTFNPPPEADAPRLARIAPVGVRASIDDPWPGLPEVVRHAWARRIGTAHARILGAAATRRRLVQGWWAPTSPLGDFGTAYAQRAAVALAGLGALPPDEAVYAGRTHDDDGEPLDGRHAYRLDVPPEGIPADAFWSLSMYEQTRDGRRFFVENPIGRYAIGDRTPGLHREPDGTLRIWIGHGTPLDPVHRANWLPAPPGPFLMTLRAYRPREALRTWTAPMPSLSRLHAPG
jgi:hypothetical protein